MSDRLDRFREKLEQQGLEAMIVAQPDNRRYMSGYTGADDGPASSAGWLLITQNEAILLTGFTNYEWARSEAIDFEVRDRLTTTYALATTDLLRGFPCQRVGFESRYIPVAIYQELVEALNGEKELVATDGLVEELRAIKDEDEIALIAEAAAIADAALNHVMSNLAVGQTEEEIAWELEKYMREHGADRVSFDSIVAAGTNSASPHSIPSARPIRPGEPLIVDMGAKVNGYCSDITRTFVVGQPDQRFTEIYDIVLKAQQAAVTAIRPGMTGREADAIARQIIADAGYGDTFGHGLGHGIGLAVHERPYLNKTVDNTLTENMVVTVEPGIYVLDWGGVRIEDTVVIRSDGVETLTKATTARKKAPRP